MSESVASLACPELALLLACGRCKQHTDVMRVSPRRGVTTACSKCQHRLSAAFRPILMHHYNNVIGYLDLQGATPFDILFPDSTFTCTCMNCGKDSPVGSVQSGQQRELWCRGCHSKLTLFIDSPRYTHLQVKSELHVREGGSIELVQSKQVKKVKDAAIQEGRPLPDNGICKHYKKSFRWLRFPCCGKAYPCDVCHDDKEDHEMEWASRMICGYCCREQPFSNTKPCAACSSAVTKMRTSHWEGGRGCRNKTAMSKNDKQKYANVNKTVAKKVTESSQNKNKNVKK